MMGVVPRAVTVWAVELGKDVEPDETKGTLELASQALLFTPSDVARPVVRLPVSEIVKVRRLRGSPVLMVERTTASGPRRTAFRNPRRKARRDNVGYLGTTNREKKAALNEWVRAVRTAAARAASGPDQAAAES
jgi:hypothetical protein